MYVWHEWPRFFRRAQREMLEARYSRDIATRARLIERALAQTECERGAEQGFKQPRGPARWSAMIVDPKDFWNFRYEAQEGALRFFAASEAVIVVGSYDARYQLCHIRFAKKDGSIFIQVPYLPKPVPGVICAATIPPHHEGPLTFSFTEGGKAVSHFVKLSHHPDGTALFSQDKKVLSIVRRKSFDLRTSIGHVFDLHVYWPGSFEPYDGATAKKDRVYLHNIFRPTLPNALTITAEWQRKGDITANIDPPGGITGPLTTVRRRHDEAEYLVTYLGQPEGWPLREHVLAISCSATRQLENVDEPTIILLGGLDPHETTTVEEKIEHTGCLILTYPVESYEALAARIGTADYSPAPAEE